MKRYILIVICHRISFSAIAQPLPDSVKVLYDKAKAGSEKGKLLARYLMSIKDSSNFFTECLELSNYFKNNNDQAALDYVQLLVSSSLSATGDYATGLNQSLQILARFERRKDDFGIGLASDFVSLSYYYSGDIEKCSAFGKKGISQGLLIGDKKFLASSFNNLGSAYTANGMPDSALVYIQQAIRYSKEINDPIMLATAFGTLAETYIALKKYDLALSSLVHYSMSSTGMNAAWAYNDFAKIFLETNKQDSARHYARLAIDLSAKR